MENEKFWYACQTKLATEFKVRQLLEFKHYECFVPSYVVKRRWSDRTVNIELPLFPGYVFFCLTESSENKVVSTPGVIRIVRFGGEPAAIPPEDMDALRRLVTTDFMREPWKYVPVGTLVRVETGPLKGICGTFSKISDRQLLILSVTILRRSIAVQLDTGTEVSVIESPSDKLLSAGPVIAASILRSRSAVFTVSLKVAG